MRYLQSAFAGEGASDFDFLKPLMERLLDDVLLSKSTEDCEVGPPFDVKPNNKPGNAPDAVVSQVLAEFSYIDVLFYHSDAGNDVAGAYVNRVQRVSEGLADAGWSGAVVGVVPRREMEAWALADSVTLCAVLGLRHEAVSVPRDFRPTRVEGIRDPKAALDKFVTAARGRTRISAGGEGLLTALSQRIELAHLSEVPQVRRLYADLESVLRSQGVLG